MGGNIASSAPTQNWPAPNYEDPVTRSWLPIFYITFHGFASIPVVIRFVLRFAKKAGGFGLDDAFLLPAWLFGTSHVAFACWSSFDGIVDRHAWDVRPDRLWMLPLSAWVGSLIFVLATGLLKISVLLFYRRIGAQTFAKKWKYAVYGAIGFTVAYTIALVLLLVFNCTPTEAYWRAYDPFWAKQYHCIDTKAINPLSGAFTILSDIYSIVLPCIMCRKLAIPWRQKLALNLVFCTGIVVVAASAARTWALTKLGTTADVTWQGFYVFLFAGMEIDLGLLCTCVPALRVLFKRQLNDTTRETTELTDRSNTYNAKCIGPLSPTINERPVRPARPSFGGNASNHPWSRLSEEKDSVLPQASRTMGPDSPVRSPNEFEEVSLHILQTSRKSFRMGVRDRKDSTTGSK